MEDLSEVLNGSEIEIVSTHGHHVKLKDDYKVEVEDNSPSNY